MNNKLIIEELKNLNLSLKKIKDWDDEKFTNRADETKIYILTLLSDKKDKDLKKEIINKWEEYMKEYVKELPEGDVLKKNQAKNKLKNLLKSLIKVQELENQDSWDNGLQVRIIDYRIQNIKIEEVMRDTLNEIECTNKTRKEKEEARQKLNMLRKNFEESWLENRKIIKWFIKRFADFSRDVFIILIPAVIKYSVSNDHEK